jgi:hypothetical protein
MFAPDAPHESRAATTSSTACSEATTRDLERHPNDDRIRCTLSRQSRFYTRVHAGSVVGGDDSLHCTRHSGGVVRITATKKQRNLIQSAYIISLATHTTYAPVSCSCVQCWTGTPSIFSHKLSISASLSTTSPTP